MEYWANRFIKRLVEIHPTCQSMFSKTSAKQGRLLMNMISLLIEEVEEESQEKFKKTLQTLAHCHNRVGVRAAECKPIIVSSCSLYAFVLDSIFGEVLFWTMRHTLGAEVYDASTHTAWVKLYSRMLDIIIPVVVEYEKSNRVVIRELQSKRLAPILQVSNTMLLPADMHTTHDSSVHHDSVHHNDVSVSANHDEKESIF
jgi:hemoglobin-like flavoprotein